MDWIYKVEKFFDMAYVPEKKLVKFVAYNLREENLHGGSITNHKKTPSQVAHNDIETHEATPAM